MKRTIIIMILMFFVLTSTAFTHPPSKVSLFVEGQSVNVTYVHGSRDIKEHFINEVRVILNDRTIIQQILAAQTGKETTILYVIPSLKKGDVIEAKALCNKGGDKTAQLTVK